LVEKIKDEAAFVSGLNFPLGLAKALTWPEAAFVVKDANVQKLAYVYFEEEPGRRRLAGAKKPVNWLAVGSRRDVGQARSVPSDPAGRLGDCPCCRNDCSGRPQPFFFDDSDLGVYFNSSRWVIEGGRFIAKSHPNIHFFANIIFGAFLPENLISPGLRGFCVVWIASACFIYYLCLVYRVARGAMTLALFAWLAPAPIFFALYRYDLYPALATLISLFAIRREAAALKGYALFLLPAYCIFMIYKRGLPAALDCRGAIHLL
jgi:hypothetical protein